ncbi:hypothetical protein NDU88_003040 [Pleurodeles waltl]|uniref:Uncharacterized protein n=1 Tax=Pleurodeles waltl TaxID=8319 RepID=A0AAV7T3U2_PLEWA|nr:hypothetical protein NDU88_003040 [Pleurodeles waltl]
MVEIGMIHMKSCFPNAEIDLPGNMRTTGVKNSEWMGRASLACNTAWAPVLVGTVTTAVTRRADQVEDRTYLANICTTGPRSRRRGAASRAW